jgi:hypothetical protein
MQARGLQILGALATMLKADEMAQSEPIPPFSEVTPGTSQLTPSDPVTKLSKMEQDSLAMPPPDSRPPSRKRNSSTGSSVPLQQLPSPLLSSIGMTGPALPPGRSMHPAHRNAFKRERTSFGHPYIGLGISTLPGGCPEGVRVVDVAGPAMDGGIEPQDVVVTVGGLAIETASSLAGVVACWPVNAQIILQVLRRQEVLSLAVITQERPRVDHVSPWAWHSMYRPHTSAGGEQAQHWICWV